MNRIALALLFFTSPSIVIAQYIYDYNGNLVGPGNIVTESVATGTGGYWCTSNGDIRFQDGNFNRNVVRNGPIGSTLIDNNAVWTSDGIVTTGARTGPAGNTITSDGSVVLSDGSIVGNKTYRNSGNFNRFSSFNTDSGGFGQRYLQAS